jgi:hypothetical protein
MDSPSTDRIIRRALTLGSEDLELFFRYLTWRTVEDAVDWSRDVDLTEQEGKLLLNQLEPTRTALVSYMRGELDADSLSLHVEDWVDKMTVDTRAPLQCVADAIWHLLHGPSRLGNKKTLERLLNQVRYSVIESMRMDREMETGEIEIQISGQFVESEAWKSEQKNLSELVEYLLSKKEKENNEQLQEFLADLR